MSTVVGMGFIESVHFPATSESFVLPPEPAKSLSSPREALKIAQDEIRDSGVILGTRTK
jgi:hypothetical protein